MSESKAGGKFIVLYGINNLGKSTQAKLLVERLQQAGLATEYIKYPNYDLEPTGPQLNEILRSGRIQTMPEIELQTLYAQNRRDYQPTLIEMIKAGKTVVAEDYTGTGLAWGVTKGAALEELEQINGDLIKENLAILLDGERFLEGKESNHLHEKNDDLMNRCRATHRELAERYGWQIVNANQPPEVVADQTWQIVKNVLA
jgi:dTMP kinase